MNAVSFDPIGARPEVAAGAVAAQAAKPQRDPKDEAAWKVAEGFEAMFIHSMLKQMRATTFEDEDSIDGSNATRMYRSMFDEKIAEVGGRTHQFGIARMLHDHLVRKPAISDSVQLEKTSNFRRYDFFLDPAPAVSKLDVTDRD